MALRGEGRMPSRATQDGGLARHAGSIGSTPEHGPGGGAAAVTATAPSTSPAHGPDRAGGPPVPAARAPMSIEARTPARSRAPSGRTARVKSSTAAGAWESPPPRTSRWGAQLSASTVAASVRWQGHGAASRSRAEHRAQSDPAPDTRTGLQRPRARPTGAPSRSPGASSAPGATVGRRISACSSNDTLEVEHQRADGAIMGQPAARGRGWPSPTSRSTSRSAPRGRAATRTRRVQLERPHSP